MSRLVRIADHIDTRDPPHFDFKGGRLQDSLWLQAEHCGKTIEMALARRSWGMVRIFSRQTIEQSQDFCRPENGIERGHCLAAPSEMS